MPPLLIRLVLAEVTRWYAAGVALFLTLQMVDVLSSTVSKLLTYQPPLLKGLSALLAITPTILNRALVLAVPFAILLAFSRMQRDSELKAISAGGVPPLRLVWPLTLPFLAVAAVAYVNADRLVPAGLASWDRAWYSIYDIPPPPPRQERYTYAPPGALYYAGRIVSEPGGSTAQLQGVMVQRGQETLTASLGSWDTQNRTWTLTTPWITRPGQPPRQSAGSVTVPQTDSLREPPGNAEQAPTADLRARAADPALLPADRRAAAFQLARRVADPLTAVVFALAAGALGLLLRNRAAAFAAVLLFIVTFYVLWSTVPGLATAGALNPALAAWLPNLTFMLLAAALAWRLR
ncbi:LptF/LptG family permease [Deinococcus sp. LM3]|uniref:LptF/LptG family permease n=1 Tax=Deinococcus sp. LM3 TaxID=1938608 RepID=UPI000992EEEE|nr:LptF/LptG family permease [Deinococcus sp. LM3]OOV14458.1 permease [Deinococcus sp. LM3]